MLMKRLAGVGLVTGMLAGIATPSYAAECAPPEAIEAYEAGKAHLESGPLDKGIAEIERAVAIYPDFADAWYDLYESYKRANRADDAIVALEQLVRLQPGAEIWRGLLALHKAEAGIPPAAVEALARCRELKPGSKQAIAACQQAVSHHPGYVDGHYFLGINYVYAGDEEAAKKQLARLVELDLTMAGMLANAMDMLTDWLTEDYQQELQAMLEVAGPETKPEAPREAAPAAFSDQELARIRAAYEKQIEALRNLVTDPSALPGTCGLEAPIELRDQLKQKLMPLSFIRIERSHKPECRHGLGYLLLDVRDPADRQRGLSEVVKFAEIPGPGDPERERWRVGLYQEWVAEKYCKAECSAMLEFRVDSEIGGQAVTFNAWVTVLEDIADIGQCSAYYGETPGAQEW